VGKDLREGKITLPLIYTLSRIDMSERRRLQNLFVRHQASENDYQEMINLVRGRGALEQIRKEAHSCVETAAGCLSFFPDVEAKRNLLELSQYIIQREY